MLVMSDSASRIIDLYERHATTWDKERSRSLFERSWLNRFRALLPQGSSILDLGCGSGEPIARYFIETGYRVTGIDSSSAMIAFCRTRFANETWHVADMRALRLDRQFGGILAWDSFFHLRKDDQRNMFAIFRAHAAPGAALMFTSGPQDGEAIGTYGGEPLYHASLAPEEYRARLAAQGFEVVHHIAEDRACGGRTVWLARLKEPAA
jgi:SAM-dependent methyltransferase